MSRPAFTPSEVGRVSICIGSAVLPRVAEITHGATVGTGRHRFLERVPEIGREAALAEIDDAGIRGVCAEIDVAALADILDRRAFVAELAMAWDVRTGAARELARGRGRAYQDISPTEIPGTADAAALVDADGGIVLDYKPEFGHQANAERHYQLRLLALMFARAFARDWMRVMIVRPSDDGAYRSSAVLDMFELAAVAEETRSLAGRVWRAREAFAQGELPPLTVHDGCRRCPSARFCPAQRSLIEDMADGGATTDSREALVRRWTGELDPAKATTAWHRAKAARAALDMVDEALEMWAIQHGGIRVDDERVYGLQQVRRESIVGNVAWNVLKELFGAEAAWSAAEVKVTKAALERLVEARLEKGQKKTHVIRDLLAKIDAAGGLRAKTQDEVRVHRAKVAR